VSTLRARLAAACWSACLAALGCTPDSGPAGERFEPPRLVRAAPNRAGHALEYSLDSQSRVTLELGGGQRRLQGELPITSGRLWIDGADLGATRGTLTFDLTQLRWWDAGSKPPPEGATATTSTEQSLDWLQLSRSDDIQSHPELRYARFTLLTIGSSSSNDLDAAPTVRSGQSAVVARRVRLQASGELELHGHRLPHTVSLAATFEWPAPVEPGAPPRRVRIETSEPFTVDLLGHRIVPRNARGEILADGLAELRRLSRSPVQARASWLAQLANAEPAASGADPTVPDL